MTAAWRIDARPGDIGESHSATIAKFCLSPMTVTSSD